MSQTPPVTIYGAADCEDTAAARALLQQLGVPFEEIDIDRDAAAATFVTVLNGGNRSTPTIVVGAGRVKMVLTEPTDAELRAAVGRVGG
jgi:mycoredoxin